VQQKQILKNLPTLVPELSDHTSFFISLSLGSTVEHPCVKDMYRGMFRITGKDSFEWDWKISGPMKDGTITCTYRRDVLMSSQEDSDVEARELAVAFLAKL